MGDQVTKKISAALNRCKTRLINIVLLANITLSMYQIYFISWINTTYKSYDNELKDKKKFPS